MTLSGVLCKDLLRFGVGRTLRTCCGKFSMPSLGEAFTTATGGAGNHAQAGTMTPGGVKERVCRKGTTWGEDCDCDRTCLGACEGAPMVLMPEIVGLATTALGARDISGPRAGVEINGALLYSLRGLQIDEMDEVDCVFVVHTSLHKLKKGTRLTSENMKLKNLCNLDYLINN